RSTSATQVFLSYHRETSAGWANLFAQELRNTYSISSFLDTNRSDSVVRFSARIEQAIANCDVFVCFLGPGTLESDWVCHEIRCADSLRKAMLPVFHEDFKYPEAVDSVDPAIRALLEFDGVHLLDKRNIHVEHTIADLANKIKEEVNRRREERAEAGSA